jgi:WD40 repeat protein
MAFSPDGRWLVFGSDDGVARLWIATLEGLVELDCQKVHCNLTQKERRQYQGNEPYRKTCLNLPVSRGISRLQALL